MMMKTNQNSAIQLHEVQQEESEKSPSSGSDYSSDTYEFDFDMNSRNSIENTIMISVEKQQMRSPTQRTVQNNAFSV